MALVSRLLLRVAALELRACLEVCSSCSAASDRNAGTAVRFHKKAAGRMVSQPHRHFFFLSPVRAESKQQPASRQETICLLQRTVPCWLLLVRGRPKALVCRARQFCAGCRRRSLAGYSPTL